MIARYIKNYKHRTGPIVLVLLVLAILLIFSTWIFNDKVAKFYCIRDSYDNYTFNYGYIVSQETGIENEVIYADTDISFYKDVYKNNKIVASSIMETQNTNENYCNIFNFSSISSYNDLIIPRNIANKYDLKIGDIIYCEYSYTSELISSVVIDITDGDAYDFAENSVKNDVGLIAIGNNSRYVNSAIHNFVILSETSMTEKLGDFSGMIKGVFGKSRFEPNLFEYLIVPIIINLLIMFVGTILYVIFVKNKTCKDLKILINKGITTNQAIKFGFLETTVCFFVPTVSFFILVNMIFSTNTIEWISINSCSILVISIIIAISYCFAFKRKGIVCKE